MRIKVMSYEECREDFFVNLIKHAENKIKYWERQKGYHCEIEDNLSNAGAEMEYCRDALKALEKQIPKKPIVDPANLCDFQNYHCPKCNNKIIARLDGEWIAGRLQKYCDNCGQALDWSDTE